MLNLRAEDSAGNLSPPLSASIVIKDTEAPTWNQDSTLVVTDLGETSLNLAWSTAADNVGVEAYVIRSGDDEIGRTDGDTALNIDGLSPWTQYRFTVWALDSSGNQSQGPFIAMNGP